MSKKSGAAAAASKEDDQWRMAFVEDGQIVTPAGVEKNKLAEAKIGWRRTIVQIILLVQVIGIYLPCLRYVSDETTIKVSSETIILRILGVLFALFLTIYCNATLSRRVDIHLAFSRAIVVKCASFVCEMTMFSEEGNYAIPMVLGFVSIFLTIVAVAILCVTYFQIQDIVDDTITESFYTRFVSQENEDETKNLVSLKRTHDRDPRYNDESEATAKTFAGDNTLMRQWNATYMVRRQLHRQETFGHRMITIIQMLLMLLFLSAIIYEFSKIFLNQEPLFTTNLCAKYNKNKPPYFPKVSHNSYKVHLVVMDGLRYDMTNTGKSDLSHYIDSPAFKPYSARYLARAQLPSFSVPNWAAILTGAPPENTGITGNLYNLETPLDNIFSMCSAYNLGRGMTGTPWWKNLVTSSMEPLDSDGTIDASYAPPGWPTYAWATADPADHVRLSVALKGIRKSNADPNAYKFFLTHFSDIDKQGHEYGISTKWNTRNSYMGAIKNKTQALMDIVDAISDATPTILIVTSDHGHVMRGGHGGTTTELRDTPVIFFTKNKIMTLEKTLAFPNEMGPNFGLYQNLDISATITALLGLPAPRQSNGVIFEDVFRTFVPQEVQGLHYYDLFMAKRATLMIYNEVVYPWNNPEKAFPLEDPEMVLLIASNPNTTNPMRYANAIRKILTELDDLRDLRADFIITRNLIAGIVVFVVVLLMVAMVYDRNSMISIRALFDENNPCSAINRKAFIVSGIAVVVFYVLSILTFIIGYYGVTGYDLWDSTLAHTPSVMGAYIVRTIIAPIIYQLLIFRGLTASAIHWRFFDIKRSLKGNPKISVSLLATWVGCIFADIRTFVFGTSTFKQEQYPFVYLFIQYSVAWTTLAAQLLILLSFPYSFMFPVALSTSHVTAFNLQWRFRILTIQIISVPLMIGVKVMHQLRPSLRDETIAVWDRIFLELVIYPDRYNLRAQTEEFEGTEGEGDLSARRSALTAAIALMENGLMKFGTGHLHEMLTLCSMASSKSPNASEELKRKDSSRDVKYVEPEGPESPEPPGVVRQD